MELNAAVEQITPQSDLILTLIQTGGIAAVLWFVLIRVEAAIKDLTLELHRQSVELSVLMTQQINAANNVAHEVHTNREEVKSAIERLADKLNK